MTSNVAESPSVSVVVPTVGRAHALARCLGAIMAGTSLPEEILVVDQSGGAEVALVVEEHRKALAGIRRLATERRGLSAARNAGVGAATGTIVAFTDDDCVPDRGWVAGISAALAARRDAAAVTGPMLPLPASGDRTFAVSSRVASARREFSGRAAPWLVGTGGNCAVRRDWLRCLGGYDERLGAGSAGRAGEDLDLIDRVLAAGGTILYEPRAVVSHERQTRARRRATRLAYGHGVGAWCALALRRHDLHAVLHLFRWTALRVRLFGGALARREGRPLFEELAVLAGTLRGLAYGLRPRR